VGVYYWMNSIFMLYYIVIFSTKEFSYKKYIPTIIYEIIAASFMNAITRKISWLHEISNTVLAYTRGTVKYVCRSTVAVSVINGYTRDMYTSTHKLKCRW